MICIVCKITGRHLVSYSGEFQRVVQCPTIHLLSAAHSSLITATYKWRFSKSNFSAGQTSACCKSIGGIQRPYIFDKMTKYLTVKANS